MLLGRRNASLNSCFSRHVNCPAPEIFKVIEVGEPFPLNASINVTCFDTQHCPGSVMFLFEGVTVTGATVRDICTGDARFEDECITSLADMLQSMGALPVDHLYLDTTFCMEEFSRFDMMATQAQSVVNCIRQNRLRGQHVYLDCSMLGSEVILQAVADSIFPDKIDVTPLRLAELECVLGQKATRRSFTSENGSSCFVHAVEGGPP